MLRRGAGVARLGVLLLLLAGWVVQADGWDGTEGEESEAGASAEEPFLLPESSQECHEQHPRHPEQRVCVVQNLLLHNNQVYYVSPDPDLRIEPFYVSWEKKFGGDELLPVKVVAPDAPPRGLDPGSLTRVPLAGLFHQQHRENHYHLFTEIAPTIHYVVCKFLGRCAYQKHDHLRLFWVNNLAAARRRPEAGGYATPPAIRELLLCLSGAPVRNIYNATVLDRRGVLLETAVVGLPLNVRHYHQKRSEWKDRFQDPPPLEFMRSYRRRVSDCLGHNFVDEPAPTRPLRVTFVNRHYEAGRAILNAETIKRRIQRMQVPPVLGGIEVQVVYLEGSLREQAAQIWNSSIFIWAHGSAMAQTFFLPRGAQAIEVVQWVVDDPSDQHAWVAGIRSAFGLDIGLDVVTNNDKTKTFFNYDVIRAPGSQYHRFNHSEKVALLEDRQCPEVDYANGAECFGWAHWGMSLVLKWELLKPALEAALQRLAQRAEGWERSAALAGGGGGDSVEERQGWEDGSHGDGDELTDHSGSYSARQSEFSEAGSAAAAEAEGAGSQEELGASPGGELPMR